MRIKAIKYCLPIAAIILLPTQEFTAEEAFRMGTTTVTTGVKQRWQWGKE